MVGGCGERADHTSHEQFWAHHVITTNSCVLLGGRKSIIMALRRSKDESKVPRNHSMCKSVPHLKAEGLKRGGKKEEILRLVGMI